mmetsp:Transcript_28899/g.46517  ORF Transcript_28899/g.46517 Transcript_28899/m.46517 type:complete len:1236 (-) Transcript_28899:183-3890(-)
MAENGHAPAASSDATAQPENGAAPAASSDGAQPEVEKKKRGKPKDENAPPKPKNAFSKFSSACRARLKEERPELLSDLSGMGKALAEEWAKVPQEEKDRSQKEYEKEMEIWKPKWEVYKQTAEYKAFVEVKTDWLDKRSLKKLVKTMNKEAPKRPKSGYMLFASEIREEVLAIVKEKGLGLGDAGKMISERWNALSEANKASYGETSQKQKIEFDQEFAKYKLTDAFGNFVDAKNKMEASQKLKKLQRTKLDEKPKSAPSAYALFRNEVMPSIVKENKEKPEGEAKLSMGEIGKKVASLWVEVPEEKKAEYRAISDKAREEYERKLKAFKTHMKYMEFVEGRAKIKSRENLLVQLREMPKRPKSVFAMFSQDHKNEVPAGKGEGKGTHALRKKFEDAPEEEKKKYEETRSELEDKWKEKVVEFKAGVKYQTFAKTKEKIDMEFKNEAIKITTLKFLDDAPPAPPKSPFAVFVGEKRKAEGQPEEKKTKEAKKQEVLKLKDDWLKLDKVVREGYEVKRKEFIKGYEEEIKAFMAAPKWQDYQKEAKRLRIPIKSLLFHKKMVIKRLKDGKINPASIPLPSLPEEFPSKPKKAMQLFVEEKKKTVESLAEVHEMWKNLSPEDKVPWDKQAAEASRQFQVDVKAFAASEEGKKFLREKAAALRRRGAIAAKNKYLDDLPKKPASAVMEFMKKQLHKVRKANPELKGHELKKKMEDMWKDLPAEEKDPLVAAADEKMKNFTEAMSAFKASDNWKKYQFATKVKTKFGKPAGAAGPKAPPTMPKKVARNAFEVFAQEMSGKGLNLAELQKQFKELTAEDRQKYHKEADQNRQTYKAALEEFEKSKEGRQYKLKVKSFIKQRKIKALKAKYLKDEPKRPPNAYFIFRDENSKRIAEEHNLKAMGDIMKKVSEVWKEMNAEDKKVWLSKEQAANEEFREKIKEFQESDNYKKFRRLLSLTSGSGAKSKGKSGGASGPPAPDNLPKEPKNAFFMFCEECRKDGMTDKKEIHKKWTELGAAGQKEYNKKVQEAKKVYAQEMKEFRETADGKKYLRLKEAAEKKGKLMRAKARFLTGKDPNQMKEPKRPPSAYFMFIAENSKSIETSDPKERAKELAAKWSGLAAEDKKEWESKAKEAKAKYEEEMKAFRESPGYKAYERTLNSLSGKQAKLNVSTARAKASGRAKAKAKKASGPGRGAAKAAAKRKSAASNSSGAMGSDSSAKSSSSKKSSSSSKKSSKSNSSD